MKLKQILIILAMTCSTQVMSQQQQQQQQAGQQPAFGFRYTQPHIIPQEATVNFNLPPLQHNVALPRNLDLTHNIPAMPQFQFKMEEVPLTASLHPDVALRTASTGLAILSGKAILDYGLGLTNSAFMILSICGMATQQPSMYLDNFKKTLARGLCSRRKKPLPSIGILLQNLDTESAIEARAFLAQQSAEQKYAEPAADSKKDQ